MNIQIISKIGDLIIGNHKDLKNKFSNKEIIIFFVETGIDRDYIYSFVLESKTPKAWLNAFLKDLYDNGKLDETLKNIGEVISFYNTNFNSLISECFKGKTTLIDKKIGFLTPYDKKKEKKLNIFNEISKNYGWTTETFDIYDYGDDKFLWTKIKTFLETLSLFIIDLRDDNKNVLLELGYILALNKPTIIIIPEGEKVPSDLNGAIYVREQKIDASNGDEGPKIKQEFENELKKAIEEKINNL